MDREIEQLRNEVASINLANEEYRKLLASKTQTLVTQRKECEAKMKEQGLKLTESDLSLEQARKRIDYFVGETKSLQASVSSLTQKNMQMERDINAKDEAIEVENEQHESKLKEK